MHWPKKKLKQHRDNCEERKRLQAGRGAQPRDEADQLPQSWKSIVEANAHWQLEA